MMRASGLFLLAPILSHPSFPRLAKVGLLVLFSGLVVSTLPDMALPQVDSLLDLTGLILKEILTGVLIGFVFMLMFYGVQSAGSLVGYQMALAMAAALDPSTQSQESIIGRFWFLMASLIFLGINGHHLVIKSFYDSFAIIAPGSVMLSGSAAEMIMKYSAYVFVIALKIAAPAMVTLFLVDITLGVVSKLMPTMNVFVLSFGLKIAVGLFIIGLSLPILRYVLKQTVAFLDSQLYLLVAALGTA